MSMGNEIEMKFVFGIAERNNGEFIIFRKYDIPMSGGGYLYLCNGNAYKPYIMNFGNVEFVPFDFRWTTDIHQAWSSYPGMRKQAILDLALQAKEDFEKKEEERKARQMKMSMSLERFKQEYGL